MTIKMYLSKSIILFFLFSIPIFVYPFISGLTYPLFSSYINIYILSLFLIYCFGIKEFRISNNPFSKPLMLYMASIGLSMVYSINLRSAMQETRYLIPLFCLLFFASNLKEKQSIKLIKIILVSASILGVYGIYQYFWGFEHLKEYLNIHLKDALKTTYAREILETRRAIGTFFSPNMFGIYLAMAIPICAGFLLKKRSEKKSYAFALLSLTLILTALILTKSLAAWLSLFSGIVLFLAFYQKHLSRRVVFIFFISAVLITVSLLILRYDMFFNFTNQQNTVLQRISFWRNTAKIIRDFPFKGIGTGNLPNIYLKYRGFAENETMFSHNIFLQTWAETGILGIIAIILLISAFIRTSFKIERNFINAGLIISSYAFIINNLFDFSYFIPQVSFLWWTCLGLIARQINPLDKKSNGRLKVVSSLIILLFIYLTIRSVIALTCSQKKEYTKAIAIEPYNDLYYAALKDYKKAIALNPYCSFYHKDLAISYLNKNMIKEAMSEFEKASNLDPANPFLHQELFDLYTKIGAIEKAKKEEIKFKEFHSKYSGYFIR
jgi:putative inorganic carbon (hco3(-)) transporter